VISGWILESLLAQTVCFSNVAKMTDDNAKSTHDIAIEADEVGSLLEDPIKKTVNISEEFRRAKRNSLFWSSLTLLAIIGVPTSQEQLAKDQTVVSLFQIGLSFTQAQIIAVCFLVSLFMIIGFRRAEAVLLVQNTELMRERWGEHYSSILKSLINDANSASAGIESYEHEAKRATKQAEAAAQPILHDSKAIVDTLRQLKSDLDDKKFYDQVQGQGPRLNQNKVSKNIHAARDRLTSISTKLDAYPEVPEKLNESELDNIKLLRTNLEQSIAKIANVSETMRGFDRKLGLGEKRWFWFFDQVPVYGLFTLSALLTIHWFLSKV